MMNKEKPAQMAGRLEGKTILWRRGGNVMVFSGTNLIKT